jgi:acetyl esterase/lipase
MAGMFVEAAFPSPRSAELRLRGRAGALNARVHWPAPAEPAPALMVFFPDPARAGDTLARELARLAGVVVICADVRPAAFDVAVTAFDDAAAVLGWAADHAGELDADPDRLLVAGDGAGAALAAAVTLHARDQWWPAIARQVLVRPDLDAWSASVPYASSLRGAPLAGAAPATVVGGRGDHGPCLAARLREAGVEVQELRHAGGVPVERLARALRQGFS